MCIVIENICPSLNHLYELTIPSINTRNNGYLVKRTKAKFEYGRLSLIFIREKIFDDLPLIKVF